MLVAWHLSLNERLHDSAAFSKRILLFVDTHSNENFSTITSWTNIFHDAKGILWNPFTEFYSMNGIHWIILTVCESQTLQCVDLRELSIRLNLGSAQKFKIWVSKKFDKDFKFWNILQNLNFPLNPKNSLKFEVETVSTTDSVEPYLCSDDFLLF